MPDINRIRELYNSIREKVISQITVRRTRKDLSNYPKYIDDLKDQGITFPEIAPLKPVEYDFDTKLSKLFYHTIFYLTDDDKINFYRYQAIRFLKEELRENYYDQAILVSKSLAGIMKTLMVKRLESSFHAFKITLKNLLLSTERMIEMFKNDKVLIAPDLNINSLIEKGFSMEEIEELIYEISAENPRNNVFSKDDFHPELLEGLTRDYELLRELYDEWNLVKSDPKLDTFINLLDNEVLNNNINPTQQLIIFTESKDTADYLAEKLKSYNGYGVLKISSENRKKIFETIQENFDANYIGNRKDDYKILITTDVLAEGINLHRSNVLVNYDTPWNATRLMQRIGRINRIGSVAGVIYVYNFYPSQQGDDEIRLYQNALIKLQGFHTAFGEDAQVYTHEELVEDFELFKEGMPDEEDKRLIYLRFIREFKDSNPIEFKRIKNFPLKARTGRNNKVANQQLKDNTIVFLKSPYKMEFYKVKKEGEVSAITFLEAAEVFEAKQTEPGLEISKNHYAHIQAALDEFDKDFFGSTSEVVTTTDKADAISAQAKKFLRDDVKGITHNAKTKKAADALIILIDKGTHTPLPNEIKKLKNQLQKRKITYGQMDNLILALAEKYDALDSDHEDGGMLDIDLNISPDIVISETFRP